MQQEDNCFHCGLPNDPNQVFETTVLGESRHLCCPGCLAVTEAIVENGLESYYQYRTESAERADLVPDELNEKLALYDEPSLQEEFVYDAGHNKQIQLSIEGITCAACGWLIEHKLSHLKGVNQVAINVSQNRGTVNWNPNQTSLSQIMQALQQIGYRSAPFQPDKHEANFQEQHKTYLKQLGLAGLMTMQVMMLMTGLYFDWFGNIEPQTKQYFHWIALILTTPVVLYSAKSFFAGATKALMARSVSMDVPIALAVGATYGAGVLSVLQKSGEVYFESVCMFVFLLLLSRFIEHQTRRKATQVSANLSEHLPVSANKVEQNDAIQIVLAKSLLAEDVVLVKAGEVIPVDGIVLSGESYVDESMLSGEFSPVIKGQDDNVFGGTINQSSLLKVRVTKTLKNALVSQILRMQTEAMAYKPKLAQLADRFAQIFVIAVLVISAVTYLYWYLQGDSNAFWIMIAVLVATCPCALGLATPSALICGMSLLNRDGILIKRADVLEQLGSIDTIAIDKTGTLTEGNFSINDSWYESGKDKTIVNEMIHDLEVYSEHPIAHVFIQSDKKLSRAENVQVIAGKGVTGYINGNRYWIGSPAWCQEITHSLPKLSDALPFQANVVFFDLKNVIAAFTVSDKLKHDVKQTVDSLKHLSWTLLSGDQPAHVDKVADALQIENKYSQLTPKDKHDHLVALQEKNHCVLMVGDGINDAPVLAKADISVAVGNATDVARAAADVILLKPDLSSIKTLLDVGSYTRSKVKQNMIWAVGYNLLILPFAMGGYLAPWMAVIGMSLSSIIVVVNSTRMISR